MKSPDTRFFHSPLILGEQNLSEEESKHAIKVCRAQKGDILFLCDGNGHKAEGEILDANPKSTKIFIKKIETEENPRIFQLAIACLKDDANEEIALHVSQTNLSSIILLKTEHSQEPKNSDLSRLIRRCKLKTRVSLKQSMKSFETNVEGPIQLEEWLKNAKGYLILCDIHGEKEIPAEIKNSDSPVTFLIGPEGGFSNKEIELIKNTTNAKTFSLQLGTTRLRAKTAALFAIGKML